MASTFCFGIGCYHFGMQKDPPFHFDLSDYLMNLEGTLHDISNIDNLVIDFDKEISPINFPVDRTIPNIKKGPGYFPKLHFLNIGFDVYIPHRVQKKLMPWRTYPLRTYTERFHVEIICSYHFPVTFIECIDPREECSPSDAAVVVREFLQKELKKINSKYIRFECLGPSPFHVNCYVAPESADVADCGRRGLRSERIPKLGYDKVVFYYDSEMYESPKSVKDAVYREISEELGLFYSIVQMRVVRMHEWHDIENMLDELRALRKEVGFRGMWKRFVTSGKKIDDGIVKLTDFESKGIVDKSLIARAYEEVYSDAKQGNFDTFIDHEISDQMEYPVDQANRLINLFERRRIKRLEIGALVLASVLGGVVGSLMTMALSSSGGS